VAYSNYIDPAHPYEEIAVNTGEPARYAIDGEEDRILFSFPFYDSFDVYRGTAVFSLSVKTISDRLISEGRILVGQDIAVTTEPPGFLSGIPTGTRKALASQAASIWNEGGLRIAGLNSQNSSLSLTLFSTKTAQGFHVGRYVNDELFRFPSTIKVILLASFFLTVYLSVFLIFNFRQDPVTIVQNRLKQLQISLIEQFYERKNDMDWNRWSRELELRRDEINTQLKLGIKSASDSSDIDTLIDKSWNELRSVMGGNKSAAIEEEKIQAVLGRILAAIPAAAVRAAPAQIEAQPAAAPPALEEIPALEEAEPVEALVEIGAEEEIIEVIEEAEPVEEIEEAPAAEEAIDQTEEIPEAEELVEEAEPVENIEEAEEVLEEMEPVEDVEEFEMAEEPDDAVEVMPLSEDDSIGMDLASQIEFAPSSETEEAGDLEMHEDLEIVSPFSTMLSDFSDITFIDDEEEPYENVEDSEGTDSQSSPDGVEVKKKSF
jgi:hypothetical protein